VAGSAGFITRSRQQPEYQSQTKILIGGFIEEPNPDTASINTGQALANTYAELVRTFDILQATVNALNLPMSVDELRKLVSTRIVPNTSLLVLTITYTDPVLAADIANELAHQLVLKSPTNLTPDQQTQITIATDQVQKLTAQLDLRLQLDQVDEDIAATQDQEQRTRLRSGGRHRDQLNQATATSPSSPTRLPPQRTTPEIVETAVISTQPGWHQRRHQHDLAAIVGATLAGGPYCSSNT
jgi:hypothetical protein